jgi:hypothetical protein
MNAARVALTIGSILAALGSLGYISSVIFAGDLSNREAFETPLNAIVGITATAGLVLIALAMGRGGVLGTGWPVLVATAALIFTIANSWFFGVGILAFTDVVSDEQFDTIVNDGRLVLMTAPKMLLALIGFVALGLAGWRSGSMPRAAAVFLVLGGIVSVWPPYPPGIVLFSIGVFIAARALRTEP